MAVTADPHRLTGRQVNHAVHRGHAHLVVGVEGGGVVDDGVVHAQLGDSRVPRPALRHGGDEEVEAGGGGGEAARVVLVGLTHVVDDLVEAERTAVRGRGRAQEDGVEAHLLPGCV